MCSHCWKKINDVWICVNCGLTRIESGHILFDKPFLNYKRKHKRNKR